MINEIIHDFIKNNITPKDNEKRDISEKYDNLSKMLKGVNFQSGSYARFTAITPVNDLDIIWELPENILSKKFSQKEIITKTINPVDLDVSDILNELSKELTREYSNQSIPVMKIEPRTHAVCVFFGPTEDDFSIDIVPAIPYGNNEYGETMYWVPEIFEFSRVVRKIKFQNKEKIIWIKSDPRGYVKEATELNNENKNYRHVVKFCKKWKLSVKKKYSDIKFKSFHIEMINKEIFSQNKNLDTTSGIKKFFEQIKIYIEKPQIQDRAGNGKYIDDYILELSQETKNKITNEAFKVINLLNSLSNETNSDIVKEKIRQIFEVQIASQVVTNKTVNPISRPYAKKYDNF